MSNTELDMAKSLAALGHEVRLRLYRLLVRAGDDGMNVSDIAQHLDLPPSTLAHHMASLTQAGLIKQTRQGREIINRADFRHMDAIIAYLQEECCVGVPPRAKQ